MRFFMVLLLSAMSLNAGFISHTYTGILSEQSNLDTLGIFGEPGGNYRGTAFTYSFSFDTAQCAHYYDLSPQQDTFQGCRTLTQSLTVNGTTFTLTDNFYGVVANSWEDDSSSTFLYRTSNNMYNPSAFVTALFAQTPHVAGLIATGAPSASLMTGPIAADFVLMSSINYHFYAASIEDAGVPEPASAVLLLSAVGILAIVRRKRTEPPISEQRP